MTEGGKARRRGVAGADMRPSSCDALGCSPGRSSAGPSGRWSRDGDLKAVRPRRWVGEGFLASASGDRFAHSRGSKGRGWPHLPGFSTVVTLTSLPPRSSTPLASFLRVGKFILMCTKNPNPTPCSQADFCFIFILLILKNQLFTLGRNNVSLKIWRTRFSPPEPSRERRAAAAAAVRLPPFCLVTALTGNNSCWRVKDSFSLWAFVKKKKKKK